MTSPAATTRSPELVKKYPHLRVLRQPDPWECTVSYICSANANIQKITKSVEAISEKLGDPLELDDDERHTFPRSETVLKAGPKPLKKLKLGLKRHKKILAAAERIRDGKLDLRSLAQPDVTYGEAKLQLMACYGIGPKVADCIALFALDKTQAFPIDTWVRRAVEDYFPGLDLYDEAIVQWAQDRFGEYAGYANQFLFHDQWSRKNPPLTPIRLLHPAIPPRQELSVPPPHPVIPSAARNLRTLPKDTLAPQTGALPWIPTSPPSA